MVTRTDVSAQKLNRVIQEAVQAMADMVEARDPYTAGHQRRAARLCVNIGKELNLPEWRIQAVQQAALIHDIGKLQVPSDLLAKPRLSSEEFDIIKAHPKVGYDILKGIEFPWPLAQIVLQHHERLNGSGYPDGLLHCDILLEARILAVADVIDAMAMDRPYRPAIGIEGALAEISKNKYALYDANVVDACLNITTKGEYSHKDSESKPDLVPVPVYSNYNQMLSETISN